MPPIVPITLVVWFVTPWLVCVVKLISTYAYERRHGYSVGGALDPRVVFRRIDELRKKDPVYDRIRGNLRWWFIATAFWWVGSFFAIVAVAFLSGLLAR